jgi:hypothetical protein
MVVEGPYSTTVENIQNAAAGGVGFGRGKDPKRAAFVRQCV